MIWTEYRGSRGRLLGEAVPNSGCINWRYKWIEQPPFATRVYADAGHYLLPVHVTPRSGARAGTPGIGASASLPDTPAKVPSQSDCRPSYGVANRNLRPGEPPEGRLERGEVNEGGQGFGEVLEVLGETPIAAEPGEGALTTQRAVGRHSLSYRRAA